MSGANMGIAIDNTRKKPKQVSKIVKEAKTKHQLDELLFVDARNNLIKDYLTKALEADGIKSGILSKVDYASAKTWRGKHAERALEFLEVVLGADTTAIIGVFSRKL